MAVAALIWRDGHIHPAEPSGAEAAPDALVLATFLIVSQTVLLLAADSFTLPWPDLAIDLSIGTAMVSGWRFVFRIKEPPRHPVLKSYGAAWRINALWMIGASGLIAANTRIVPAMWTDRDTLFVLIPAFVSVWITGCNRTRSGEWCEDLRQCRFSLIPASRNSPRNGTG